MRLPYSCQRVLMRKIFVRLVAPITIAAELMMPGSTALNAQGTDTAKLLDACRAIEDNAARLRCFENATSGLPGNRRPPAAAGSMEGWRLVRTPNPAGGNDAVSIMHTADLLRSDPDLAGLMIRCGEAGNEVLIALISPFPLRARPQVVLGGTSAGTRLEAKVAPPGAVILLPGEATALASGPWQSLAELQLEITNEGTAIRGVVTLKGLAAALQVLAANCPAN
jgi:hypothetical protein